MNKNYLKKHIEGFFTESTAINANLHIIDTFVTFRSNQLKKDIPVPRYELYSMMTTYRDLSQLEGGFNLYDTGCTYSLTTDILEDETLRILSYISCLTLTQVFEVFESFLKNMLAECLLQNTEVAKTLRMKNIVKNFDEIRASLKTIQGGNNKGFIKALRKISNFFKIYEKKNIWTRNMGQWFDLVSVIRHIVIHNRQNVNLDFVAYIKSSGSKHLFKEYFSIYNNLLVLTPYSANAVIGNLYEFAHLIYKGLSIDLDLTCDFDFKPISSNVIQR